MLCEISMKLDVVLAPSELKPKGGHRRALVQKLLKDVEQLKCSREHGYYICPTTVKNVSEGRIRDSTACVVFTVEFRCLVFKLIKHEVVELEVVKVTKWGVETTCGPYCSIFLHTKYMEGFEFCKADDDGCFRDSEGSMIKVGTMLRARILGVQLLEELGRNFKALATMNGDFLGVVADDPHIQQDI